MSDIVVVGGGINGLLSALLLADAGAEVTLFDDPVGRPPASWAGGGILSPLIPWRYPPALTLLARGARTRYQALQRRLADAACGDIEVLASGMLVLAGVDDAVLADWQALSGERAEPGGRCRDFPWLPAERVWLPDVASVRNPRLLVALRALVASRGVRLLHERIDDLSPVADGMRVRGGQHDLPFRRVVLTAGAWTSSLLDAGTARPLMPVKGQMLMYRPGESVPPCMIVAAGSYLIPRADGAVLVGATLEPGVTDMRPDQAALIFLQQQAERLWPSLTPDKLVAQWSGLRPGNTLAAPLIGALPGFEGRVWVNTGHYRNGLVCAPASAALLCALMTGKPPEIDPRPYCPSSLSSVSSP